MKLNYIKQPIYGKPHIIPKINKLSSYYSPAGATSLIVILGEHFNKFSIIKFGLTTPVVIFISSQQLEFYIPANTIPGNYPIQVINDNISSNIVNYNIDNSSGYWLLDPRTQTIINTNQNGVIIKPPIIGLPFLTGFFGIKNNIIDNSNTFLIINSLSSSYINLIENNYIQFKYCGTYLIQINLATTNNGFTNYSKIQLNLVSYPDTNKIIQSTYNSGIWNETTFNTSFFINIIEPNITIAFNISANPNNINITELSSQFNRLIITQIG
jgi:hypothetical protein